MKAQSVKEVLIAMKYILQNVGWTQGSYCRDKKGESIDLTMVKLCPTELGSACLVGALTLVESNYIHKEHAKIQLYQLLDNGTVTVFNDTPGRTKEEVLDLLDEAIKELP